MARYIAPVSSVGTSSASATARATVDFPAPDGPSMATTFSSRQERLESRARSRDTDTAVADQPAIDDVPSMAHAATAPASAMRWSPWLCMSAACTSPPWTTSESPSASDASTDRVEQLDDRHDAVALLHPQLGDAAEDRAALGERGGDGEHGHLVDHRLVDLDARRPQRARSDVEVPDRLAEPFVGRGELDVGAHRAEHVDELDPAGVHEHVGQGDVGALA